MQSRISGIGLPGIAAQGARRCTRRPGTPMRSTLPVGGFYKLRRRGETHAFDGKLIHTAADRGRDRQLLDLSKRYADGGARPAAGRAARPARLPHRAREADPGRRGREHHRDPQALRRARHLARRAVSPEAHETLSIAMNRIGARVRYRRGRRGPGALQAARQRRQRQLGDQADRLGPLRRHRGISQRLPRDRDQGRAGRQARRGRPAARLQGHRADRQAAPLDAGRDADLARRRITTSIRSRIWRSSSTT